MKNKDSEHILVCLSTSPSNAKIIRTAARMAEAFGGDFTALYVETAQDKHMYEKDVQQLRENTELAVQLGAKHEIVYGTDVSFQIAEFSKLNGVTRIILGKSLANQRILFGRPNLTERLIAQVTNLDIHIIPDQEMFQKNPIHKWTVRTYLLSGTGGNRKRRVTIYPNTYWGWLLDDET